MFERFTPQARQAVQDAQAEARGLHHDFIGTEHLLLALVAGTTGPAAQVLHSHGLTATDLRTRIARAAEGGGLDPDALATLGIDLEQVRTAAEASFGPGALDAPTGGRVPSGHLPLTKRAKKVLELSLRETVHLRQHAIGTGHLLLALLREGDGLGVHLLRDSGLDLDALRAEITNLITTEAA